MKTIIPDVEIEIHEDGSVDLAQDMGYGEMARITLHPAHMRFLFESVGYVEPTIPNVPARIALLNRRLRWLRDRFSEAHTALPSDFYERCADSLEFSAWLNASCTVADEFCADLDSPPAAQPEAQTKPKGNSPQTHGFSGDLAQATPARSTAIAPDGQLGLDV